MAETKRKTPAIPERWLGEWWPKPQYIAFPEFIPPPPAFIPFRIGRDVLSDVPAFGLGRFLEFKWEETATVAANPVVPFRYGQAPLLDVAAPFVLGQFFSFPFFQAEAINPVIAFRTNAAGFWDDFLAAFGARYTAFPFFQAEAAANPHIDFRYGQPVVEMAPAFVGSQYSPFPFFQTPPPPGGTFRDWRRRQSWHRTGGA